LKIAVPGYTSKEFKYVIILTLLLVLRTQMSIWLADVNGRVVKSIVEMNFKLFCQRVSKINVTHVNSDFPTNAFFDSIISCEFGYGVLF
jgi:ABC-type uncharacterized transport system fused permease/ATPase subunit